ncbi:T9SS type A sorting domain-containing protein [bacterium]|nr:T9SS type A sorting domain-containing protein [bacterium]
MTEQADINSDGIVNIIDVVLLVEIVLGYNPGRLSPSIIDLLLEEGSLNTKASGIAGFRLTTNVEDFEITNHPDNWILTQYDNQLIMINLDGSESAGKLFEYSGKIEIEDVFLIGWNGVQIETNIITVPNDFELFPAYPNPFNPQTTIDFELASDSNVKISIYNLSGREIETLENGTRQSGYYSMTWDASSQATGVYLVRMTVDNFTTTQKVMLVK